MGFVTLAEWVRPLALRALDPVVQVLPDFFAPVLVFLGALGPVWQLALVVLLIASATVSAVSVVYFCVRCQRDAVRGDLDESEDEREQDELELEQELALERKDWRRRQQQQEEEECGEGESPVQVREEPTKEFSRDKIKRERESAKRVDAAVAATDAQDHYSTTSDRPSVTGRSNSDPPSFSSHQDLPGVKNWRLRSNTIDQSSGTSNFASGTSQMTTNSENIASSGMKSASSSAATATTSAAEFLINTTTSKLLRMDKAALARKCEDLLAERRAFHRDSLSFRKMFWRVALAKEKKRNKELSSLIQMQSSTVGADANADNSPSRDPTIIAASPVSCCSVRRLCCCMLCHGGCCPYWIVLLCRIPAILTVMLCAAAWTAHYWDPQGELLSRMLEHGELHLQQKYGVATDVQGYRLSEMFKVNPTRLRVGQDMCGGGGDNGGSSPGRGVEHPVVLIPGIISSGLEVWQGKQCARSTHFRRRFWGTSSMLEKLATDRACWLEHMKLNESTWDDPDDIHLRASSGFGAADYFMTGYYLWGPLIENMADCGYDETSMHLAAYDWRLPFDKLEERDGFFSRLKSRIEVMRRVQNRKKGGNTKVMIVSHSMGTPVWLYFMQWVEAQDPGWIDREVGTWVNLAGSLLGAPKALTSVLSAEMRDTAIIEGTIAGWLKDKAFPRPEMIRFFRSLGSLPSLFPLGGERVWGSGERTEDNKFGGRVLSFLEKSFLEKQEEAVSDQGVHTDQSDSSGAPTPPLPEILHEQRYYTADTTFDLLRRVAPTYMSMVDSRYTFGIDDDPRAAGAADRRAWSNPLATALPHAPGLAIACMYGVGKESELGYAFRGTVAREKTVLASVDAGGEVRDGAEISGDGNGIGEEEEEEIEEGVFVPVELDPTVNAGVFSNGVRSGDGDGTVPLVSLGLMCVHPGLWKGKPGRRATAFNPAGAVVRTREYLHEPLKDIDLFAPLSSAVQGGGGSSDHVDILGNLELQRDLLLMATSPAHEGLVEDRVVSGIEDIAKRFVI